MGGAVSLIPFSLSVIPTHSAGKSEKRERKARNSVLLHHRNPECFVHAVQNLYIQPALPLSQTKRRLVVSLAIASRIEAGSCMGEREGECS